MKDIRAGDVMIDLEKYPHVPYWFTIRQAMAEFEGSAIETNGQVSLPRVLLVFDEKYNLMGMLRRRDILRGVEPKILSRMSDEDRLEMFDAVKDPDFSKVPFDQILEGVENQAEQEIGEFMIPIETAVDFNDHIFTVIYEMNFQDTYLLPVLKDGTLIGVVRTVDVFRKIAEHVVGDMGRKKPG
jgi:CBS-domain-containing membrane protein